MLRLTLPVTMVTSLGAAIARVHCDEVSKKNHVR